MNYIVSRSAVWCARNFSRYAVGYSKSFPVAYCSTKTGETQATSDADTEEYYTLIQNAQRELMSERKRSSESLESKRRRLLCQSSKRGTLETTLLLNGFARDHVMQMNAAQLNAFDQLMNETECEWDIYLWAVGTSQPPAHFAEAVSLLRTYKPLVDYAKWKTSI